MEKNEVFELSSIFFLPFYVINCSQFKDDSNFYGTQQGKKIMDHIMEISKVLVLY